MQHPQMLHEKFDLSSFKFGPTTPNMSQHLATGWPNAQQCCVGNVAFIGLGLHNE